MSRGTTRQERLADPDFQGDPITVGLLTFKTSTDCWGEPRWRCGGVGGYVVGKLCGKWFYRQDLDDPSFHGTTDTREEAMQVCAAAHIPVDRRARWERYMSENDPPEGY